MISRDRAYEILRDYVKDDRMVKHCLACEAVMRSLALRFGEDPEVWGLVGLLHDLDYEEAKEDFSKHGRLTPSILKDRYGVELPEFVLRAIEAHAGHPGAEPRTLLERAIYAVDPTTGFVIACAMIHKDKRLSSIDVEFMLKRFKEKRFAAGADRSIIASCEEGLGIPLPEFLGLALEAMKGIASELGL